MLHRIRLIFALAFAVVVSLPAWATIYTVLVENNLFNPSHITITHGDTVVWHCVAGFHSVHHLGSPSLFGNSPAGAPWFYQFTFDHSGDSTFHYDCAVHGVAMSGTVVVQAANDAPPLHLAGNATEMALAQNYPNPFNNQTNIQFTVPIESNVRITVLDVLGQTVKQIFAGRVAAGSHTVSFNADGLSSGIYFYRMQAPGAVLVRKMNYLK